MKPTPLLLVLLCVASGCVSARLDQVPKPEGHYAPAIRAAGSISISSERTAALSNIAAKNDISEAEQLYLLDVVRVTDGFSGDRKDVLLALLENRATTDRTKKRLAEILPSLGLFSGDAKVVVDALAR